MNLKNRAARVLSVTLVGALGLAPVQVAFAAPEEGDDAAEEESPEGEEAEGEEGEEAEGEEAEGEEAEGEEAEGEEAEGEEAEGEEAEGEEAEGEEAEGEEAEGEEAEGEEAEGDEAEGEEAEGDEASEDDEVFDEGPQRPEEPRWGPNKKYKLKGTGLIASGGAIIAVGGAGIVTSLLLTRCEVSDENGCTFGENTEQRTLFVPMSAVIAASGVLLLGVGLSKRSKYKKWQNWSPEAARVNVAPTMLAGGGGGAVIEGRF